MWLFPLDADGKPTGEHGILDLAAVADAQLVHELHYNVEAVGAVSVEIELMEGGSFSATTVDGERGLGGATYAALASAMQWTAAGCKFSGDVSDVPRFRIINTTPGSGAGRARVRVWGSPLV